MPSGDWRYALIIACTRYDYLGDEAALEGPLHDVELMRNLLARKFGFARNNIRVLAEEQARAASRPTYRNIRREFKALASRVKRGDQVVVLFSGHGSQLPDDDPENDDDPEIDGLDEILCPADMKDEFDYDTMSLPNALRDDEMAEWLMAIRKKQADVCVIIDACHSGTAVRGLERVREIAPESLVPAEVLQKVRVAGTRGLNGSSADYVDGISTSQQADLGDIVAIYAAQPHETTIELPLPVDASYDDRKMYGLLTWTMAKVLAESEEPLSYRELVQRIHASYVESLGRLGPTPLIEGNGRDRQFLGNREFKDRSRLVIQPKGSRFELNAGQIHGITQNSVLAVYPPPDRTPTHSVMSMWFAREPYQQLLRRANSAASPGQPLCRTGDVARSCTSTTETCI